MRIWLILGGFHKIYTSGFELNSCVLIIAAVSFLCNSVNSRNEFHISLASCEQDFKTLMLLWFSVCVFVFVCVCVCVCNVSHAVLMRKLCLMTMRCRSFQICRSLWLDHCNVAAVFAGEGQLRSHCDQAVINTRLKDNGGQQTEKDLHSSQIITKQTTNKQNVDFEHCLWSYPTIQWMCNWWSSERLRDRQMFPMNRQTDLCPLYFNLQWHEFCNKISNFKISVESTVNDCHKVHLCIINMIH